MDLTIIVTVFNKLPFLRESLTSISAQAYAPKQVVVVDDHSTDGSWELLQELQSKLDFILLRSDRPQRGPYWIYNYVIGRYPADCYQVVDSDDRLHRGATGRLIAFMQREKAQLVGGLYRMIDHSGQELQGHLLQSNFYPHDVNTGMEIYHGHRVNNSSHIWTDALYRHIGPYDGDTICQGDSEYLYRAFAAGAKIRNLPEVVYDYRSTPSSLTGNTLFGLNSPYRQAYLQRLANRFPHQHTPDPRYLSFFAAEKKHQPQSANLAYLEAEYNARLGRHQVAQKLLYPLVTKDYSSRNWFGAALDTYLKHGDKSVKVAALNIARLQAKINNMPSIAGPLLILRLCRPSVAAIITGALPAPIRSSPGDYLSGQGQALTGVATNWQTITYSSAQITAQARFAPKLADHYATAILLVNQLSGLCLPELKPLLAKLKLTQIIFISPFGMRTSL